MDDLLIKSLKTISGSKSSRLGFAATGSESRDPDKLQQYLAQVRRALGTNVIDAFFIEYLSPQDSDNEVETVLTVLQRWKAEGWIRYVGASTHNP